MQKPKFIPKKLRKELAKEEEAEKIIKQKQFNREIEKERRNFDRKVREARRNAIYGSEHAKESRRRESERRKKSQTKEEIEREIKEKTEKENKIKLRQDIKDTYLGRKKRQKRAVPLHHHQRFCFDWEPSEDTSADFNALYDKKADVTLAFGRGFVAGVDRETQRERNKVYRDMMKRHKSNNTKYSAKNYKNSEKHDKYGKNDKKTSKHDKSDKTQTKYEKNEIDSGIKKALDMKEERMKRLERKRKELKARRHIWKGKSLEEMTPRDWRILREDFNISTRGAGLFNPIRSWEEAPLAKQILKTLKKVRYSEPTPIQRIAIPVGLASRDVVGIAETGSGKTCAFLLPMLSYILKLPPMTPKNAMDGPYAIILAPARELAQQIEREASKFSDPLGIKSISVVGGVSFETQALELRNGAEILIATPGRLVDCLERKYVVLNQCNYIVLDEADRMIDMGFEPQVIDIFERMPSSNLQPENPEEISENKIYRQTIMFSATMPLQIEKLSKKYLRNPMYLSIGDRFGKAADNVKQYVEFVTENEKRKRLQEILERADPPIMIFCNHKKQCDTLAKYFNTQGYNCATLHGGKSQENREAALKSFREHDIDILICTDVAGRGIDVKGVTHVINFDMPNNIEYYTHRIGRTGRAGEKGQAITFLTNGDEMMFYDLKKLLINTNNIVPPELANHPKAMHAPGSVLDERPKIVYAQ